MNIASVIIAVALLAGVTVLGVTDTVDATVISSVYTGVLTAALGYGAGKVQTKNAEG